MSKKQIIELVSATLSQAKMSTYKSSMRVAGDEDQDALTLYAWNTQVSAELLAPLHMCEVVIRNAISDALTAVYGPMWPWNPVFLTSLPNPRSGSGYSPRRELSQLLSKLGSASSAGRVIPEIKFVFWQKMFTQRHDVRIWSTHLHHVFPNLDRSKSLEELRKMLHDTLGTIRSLRNRVAHHEPIFQRNLINELDQVVQLIKFRCAITAKWTLDNHPVKDLILACPCL